MTARTPCSRHGFDPHDDDPAEPCVWCGLPRTVHDEGECRTCVGNGWRSEDDGFAQSAPRRVGCVDCGGSVLELPRTDWLPFGMQLDLPGTGLAEPGGRSW